MTSKGLSRHTVHPSKIAQYYSLQQCPMYLYQEYVRESPGNIGDVSLSPLFAQTGIQFETGQIAQLLDSAGHGIGPADVDRLAFDETWSGNAARDQDRFVELVDAVANGNLTEPVVAFQAHLETSVEAWPVAGDVDGLVVVPELVDGDRGAHVRVLEMKSSTTAKTHHQLQAAVYARQLRSLLADRPIRVSATIVTRSTPVDPLVASGFDLSALASFDLAPRENDVRLLLEAGGTLDMVLLDDDTPLAETEEPSPPNYRIDARCDGCAKQAKCVAYAAANHDLALLGFSEGVQETLRDHGIEHIEDLVDLYELPADGWDRKPTADEHPKPRDPERVAELQAAADISNLADRVQIAHRFLREIDPEFDADWSERADAGPWGEYLVGTGRNLPDDDPPWEDTAYPKQSLVRVYPYVQKDHVRDRLCLLAARVDCTRSDGDGAFVAVTTEALPRDPDAKDNTERKLLEQFYEDLEEAIDEVRPTLPDHDTAAGYLHLYPYSDSQRRALVEAVKRHPDSEAAQSVRTLLGYRSDIDQQLVSVLQAEFRSRHAFRYPGLGVVQTVAQFWDTTGDREFGWERWRDADTSLKQVFDVGFFEMAVPYEDMGNRIMPDSSAGLQVPDDRFRGTGHYDGYYPLVGRHAETLPLEYLYAAEEFDALDEDWTDDEATRELIMRYRHYDGPDSPRITLDDVVDGVEAICRAYEFIERCIQEKDATVEKEPLNLADLAANTLGASELQRTLVEYQQLEEGSKRRSLENRYRQPLAQRAASGTAIPFEVTNPPENRDDHEEDLTMEGCILRQLGGSTPGVSSDTELSLGGGEYVVLTPLAPGNDGTLTETVDDPKKYANQVLARVSNVDVEEGTVSLSMNWDYNQSGEPHLPYHVGWTTDPEDEWGRRYIENGTQFVVDAALDDFPSNRARAALERATENDIHNRILGVYEAEDPDALCYDEPFCDPDALEAFLGAFDDAMPERTNADQKSFVRRVDHSVTALQGPPGTGKTSYASAPTILGRAYAAAASEERFLGVGAAHSNTAVDEIAEAVGEAQQHLVAAGEARDVTLVRVRAGSAQPDALPDNVQDFSSYDHADELRDMFGAALGDDDHRLIVFATPTTLRNTMNAVAEIVDPTSTDSEGAAVDHLMEQGSGRVFDYALVDEASMMDLPLLFLLGAFMRETRQLQLVGDHRQMQPIQSHDWETEDRQTIEEHTPAVSALDFVRFLRGHTDSSLNYLERDLPAWDDADAVLPMDQLRTTYRLPPAMADLETELFYHRDGIELESAAAADRIPDVRSDAMPAWLQAALDPEARVTLLLHDDDQFTKDSPVEAYLAEQVLSELPVVSRNPTDDQLSAGVVVPFRRMRRRMRLSGLPVTADTVERFQGDEKDVMVLAMTSGNQGYVNSRAKFLLDANRFNVGASRMKRKLFIVASKALFRAVSPDVSQYEDQMAWKQLYRLMGVNETPAPESVTLTSDEVPELSAGREVTVEVYTGIRD